jgi:hypothetical protein
MNDNGSPLPPLPRLLPPAVAAWFLGITTSELRRYVKNGEISRIDRPGKSPMFEMSDIEKFITEHRRTSQWESTRGTARRSGITGSKAAGLSFVDRLKQRQNAKRAPSKSASARPPEKN